MSNDENTAYSDLIKQWKDKQDEQNELCCEQLAAMRKQMEFTGALKKGECVRFLAILTAETAKR